MPRKYWTDERKALLLQRWSENRTVNEIAAEFEKTRNAIIGAAFRMGLSVPRQEIRKRQSKGELAAWARAPWRRDEESKAMSKKMRRYHAKRRARLLAI